MWPILTHFFQSLVWIPLYIIWKAFLRLEVSGKENLVGLKKPVIFAPNHISELDPIIVPARSINPLDPLMHMFHVSREKSFYKRKIYGGCFFKLVGAYPVVVGVRDYGKSLKTHVNFLKQKRNVCIFPEGKRNGADNKVSKVKGGVVYLAKASGCVIVPVALSGHYGMGVKDFLLRKRKVHLTYGKPVSNDELFAGFDRNNFSLYEKIAQERVMNKVNDMLQAQNAKR